MKKYAKAVIFIENLKVEDVVSTSLPFHNNIEETGSGEDVSSDDNQELD